jgi:hypothetical protein
MKSKIIHIAGACPQVLNALVAKIEGVALVDGCVFTKDPDAEQVQFAPVTDKEFGGNLLRGAMIKPVETGEVGDKAWCAQCSAGFAYHGETALIAGFRAYVASHYKAQILTDEVLGNGFCFEMASLDLVHRIVNKAEEFPDAAHRTANSFRVNQVALESSYCAR